MIESLFEKFDKINFSSFNWRAFLIALLGIFFMEIIHLLGIKPAIESPIKINTMSTKISLPNVDVMQIIKPKLEEKKTSYRLKKASSLIPQASSASGYQNASSYIVVDFESGEVLDEKDMSKPMPIASLTKIMTAVVALDLGSENDLYEVSYAASAKIPTKIGVIPGQKMNLSELLHASLLTSANDATEVIREGIDSKYNKKIFILAMNEKAKMIDLKNTSFSNPQGFDSRNNYSTAEDLALLSHYALKNYPQIREIVKKDYAYLPKNENHKQFDLYNWNGLIGIYPSASGIKIGNTHNAGKTTIVISERQGKKIMVVLLGAPGVLERDLWASQLLDYGFEKQYLLPAVKISEAQLYKKYSSWRT